jgi:hypothetical protein
MKGCRGKYLHCSSVLFLTEHISHHQPIEIILEH